MIDAERMLGSLVKNALGGELSGRGKKGRKRRRRRRGSSTMFGVPKSTLAMGALGTAIAAFEHFSGKDTDRLGRGPATPDPTTPSPGSGSVPQPGSAPLPPLPGTSTAPTPSGSAPADLPPLPPTPGSGSAPGSDAAPAPATAEPGSSGDALLLVRAMIAAAHADHDLDAEERTRIVAAIEHSGATAEEHAFLLEEIDHPQSLASLAAAATTPDLARQVYLASAMAIDVDSESERLYLAKLAERLSLSTETVEELESLLDGPPA